MIEEEENFDDLLSMETFAQDSNLQSRNTEGPFRGIRGATPASPTVFKGTKRMLTRSSAQIETLGGEIGRSPPTGDTTHGNLSWLFAVNTEETNGSNLGQQKFAKDETASVKNKSTAQLSDAKKRQRTEKNDRMRIRREQEKSLIYQLAEECDVSRDVNDKVSILSTAVQKVKALKALNARRCDRCMSENATGAPAPAAGMVAGGKVAMPFFPWTQAPVLKFPISSLGQTAGSNCAGAFGHFTNQLMCPAPAPAVAPTMRLQLPPNSTVRTKHAHCA